MTAYYNEIDPFAAQWLRNLITAGRIADGVVDERSIEDIVPSELAEFTQCHFFAGVGVWSHALRRAGWPDDRPVWTGSCPCQPFSAAGKGAGFADERHLWPAFYHLIVERRPQVVFGEQVASKDGLGWFDLVQADLEGAGYACAAVDTCAASFGAPHIRQRLYWVADADNQGRQGRVSRGPDQGREDKFGYSGRGGAVGGLADADGRNPGTERGQRSGQYGQQPEDGNIGWVEHASGERRERGQAPASGYDMDWSTPEWTEGEHGVGVTGSHRFYRNGASPANGFWRKADWLLCRDGKWRPVEPGTLPLAHGATSRVGRLRAYGNAIVAPQAQAFIESYLG